MFRQRSQNLVKMTLSTWVLVVSLSAFPQVASSQMLVNNNSIMIEETPDFIQAVPWFERLPRLNEKSIYSMGMTLINSLRTAVGLEASTYDSVSRKAFLISGESSSQ